MAVVNGELEVSQFTAKNLLEGCLEGSQLPSASEVAWLAYLMSSSRVGKLREETGPPRNCCITNIQCMMAELLKESFTNCSAQIKTTEYKHDSASAAPILWSCLMQLHEALPTSCIFPLCTLSCRASLIVYVAMEIANVSCCDHASIMNYLEEMWGAYMIGLVEQCLKMSDSNEEHQLLVRLALSLLIVTMLDSVAAWEQQDQPAAPREESGGVAPQGRFGGVAHQRKLGGVIQKEGESSEKIKSQHMVRTSDEARTARRSGWKCAVVLEPVLNNIKHNFPTYFYQRYCQYESRENQYSRDTSKSLERQSHVRSDSRSRVLAVRLRFESLTDSLTLVSVAECPVSKRLGADNDSYRLAFG